MSSLVLSGDSSGTVALAAPAVAGDNIMTLVAGTGALAPRVLSTAVASTSGTTVDFTNIPSWVTRITIIFSGVSTDGSSNYLIRIGSGSFATSGYNATSSAQGATSTTASATSTSGFVSYSNAASVTLSGSYVLHNISGNTWVLSGCLAMTNTNFTVVSAGNVTISGALDRVRITTVSADNFDAGSINIMYE